MSLWWQRPQIQELMEKYRALSEREKVLVLITTHVVIAAIYVLLIATPLWTPQKRIANRQRQLKAMCCACRSISSVCASHRRLIRMLR